MILHDPWTASPPRFPLSQRLHTLAEILAANKQARLASDAEAMAAEARDLERAGRTLDAIVRDEAEAEQGAVAAMRRTPQFRVIEGGRA